MPTLFNISIIALFLFIGFLFDKRKTKRAIVILFIIIGFIPFFSPLASRTADFSLLHLPWLIGLLLPKIFQEGHPPAFIFIAPFMWIVLGIVIAIIVGYFQRKKKK